MKAALRFPLSAGLVFGKFPKPHTLTGIFEAKHKMMHVLIQMEMSVDVIEKGTFIENFKLNKAKIENRTNH